MIQRPPACSTRTSTGWMSCVALTTAGARRWIATRCAARSTRCVLRCAGTSTWAESIAVRYAPTTASSRLLYFRQPLTVQGIVLASGTLALEWFNHFRQARSHAADILGISARELDAVTANRRRTLEHCQSSTNDDAIATLGLGRIQGFISRLQYLGRRTHIFRSLGQTNADGDFDFA